MKEAGEGMGCLFVAIALGIFMSWPKILSLIELWINKCS
jgi:hypothetical protein